VLNGLIILMLALAVIFMAIFLGIYFYRRRVYHKRQIEKSLILVPIEIRVPRDEGQKEADSNRTQSDVGRELIASAENMYNSFFGLYSGGSFDKKVKNFLFRSPHISLEIVATKKEIIFYMMVPVEFLSVAEKSITAQYPGASVVKTKVHNIFTEGRGLKGIKGGNIWGRRNYYYPIKTYQNIDDEPLETLINSLSMLEEDESAAIQILIRPVNTKIMTSAKSLTKKIQSGPGSKTSALDVAGQIINPKNAEDERPKEAYRTTPLEEQVIKEVDRKSSKFGFETRIRVLVAARDDARADLVYNQLKSSLNQYSDLSLNGFKLKKEKNRKKLVNEYIFRYFDDRTFDGERFWPKKRGYKLILNSEELATLYHLPNAQIKTPGVRWLAAKSQQIPVNLPKEGIEFAHATFRDEEEAVRITEYDKMRHVYIIGQTGTGKSVLMKNMFISDIQAGNGVCYIDPHGDGIEDLIKRIPKERAEDVIIFDASDTERPMGLNLFEAGSIEHQDLVIGEAISMLYRLYDPQHQGIMGPRFEHWFRNAALALMASPEGGTFIEVPRIFTDEAFLAEKLKYVTDPVVRNFWVNEMGQTSDFHKSEVLGWFVGKFGAFMTNTTMRNIMGQVQSSLNIRDIMDNKKILLVNLSKGLIGELNMQLLGMIFISKIQMAAMSRADIPEDQRVPFTLYVDEFQNFVTDNISGILSESRKYKLSLVMANQYIQQIREDIRDAVFGNVGSMISFRVGSEDGEFLGKQYEPEFTIPDIINQENLHAICKMTIQGLPSRPFTIVDYFPPKLTDAELETGKAIKELARLKFGRPREIVDAEVQERMKMAPAAPQEGAVPRERTSG
jgi:hypothetical protein